MQDGITMSPRQGASSGGVAMLNVIVLIAMAVTAAAVAAGLIVQAGLPQYPVLIATAALFLVMAASFVMLGRGSRAGGGGDRLVELEEALEIIDGDLQRIDKVEDDVARLDLLSDRVERLDQALGEFVPSEVPGGQARVEELATEFENVYARIESLRAEVQAETRSQRDKIAGDLGLLEGLIKRLSTDLGVSASAAAAAAPRAAAETPAAPPPVSVEVEEEVAVEIEEVTAPAPLAESLMEPESEPETETPFAAARTEPESEPEPEPEDTPVFERAAQSEAEPEPPRDLDTETETPLHLDDVKEDIKEDSEEEAPAEPAESEPMIAGFADEEDTEDAMRQTIRKAVETGRVELYLQPTVTLPDRRTRYFEALTRIRTEDDNLVLPGDYVPVAKRAGIMPLIDNVLLVRSVQALRRLDPHSKVERLFCNVSMHSLLDPDYFPELVEFMEENSSLSESLVFEVSQAELLGLTASEFSCLDTLGALGYNFCLDNVSDFEADFEGLSDRYFRYVKISAADFLAGPGRMSADLKRDLDGLGIQLIIEKVEDEGDVSELLDHGIELAQGYLFGKPKPSDAALSSETEGTGAA